MRLLWDELRAAVPLIWHGDPHLLSVIAFTAQVAAVATAIATVIGLPIGLALGLGRFPGSRTLRYLANASVALPPVLVGLLLWLTFAPLGPLGRPAAQHHPARGDHRPDDPRAPLHGGAHVSRRPGTATRPPAPGPRVRRRSGAARDAGIARGPDRRRRRDHRGARNHPVRGRSDRDRRWQRVRL